MQLVAAEHVTPSDMVWLAKGAIRTGTMVRRNCCRYKKLHRRVSRHESSRKTVRPSANSIGVSLQRQKTRYWHWSRRVARKFLTPCRAGGINTEPVFTLNPAIVPE